MGPRNLFFKIFTGVSYDQSGLLIAIPDYYWKPDAFKRGRRSLHACNTIVCRRKNKLENHGIIPEFPTEAQYSYRRIVSVFLCFLVSDMFKLKINNTKVCSYFFQIYNILCSTCTWKVYCAISEYSVLYMPIRSSWVNMLYKALTFFVICCQLVLSVTKRGMLTFLPMKVDLSLSLFSSINFCFTDLKVCY